MKKKKKKKNSNPIHKNIEKIPLGQLPIKIHGVGLTGNV